ncbi:transglutaminase [Paenibacillus sp. CAA11]|uniref:transglutaminase TgpA family protein n=1 Tax=Paenibacillus sp. CAA11 TaxID=1532905 RepID=UPI000D3C4B5A|nr:transglutaminaseTgpA domain-containing protein [Paenibacillus sp. CAA11]AWB45467.1 transglutaminase [Paenibacillus sp. CAA11]
MDKTSRFSYSWYYVISIIWLLVIAYQWLSFTDEVWYEETSKLVTFTLLTVAVIEALPFKGLYKWILKFIGVIAIHRWVLVKYGVYQPYGPVFPDQVQQFTSNLVPYVWFAVAAWALFELALRVVTGRYTILFFAGLNIIAFGILDSFTPYRLWVETAWTVFAGMAWLVCSHFRRFQLRHPQGFRHVRRHPLKIGLNIAVIFACVLLIGVSMPAVSPILTDPYSLWESWKETGSGQASSDKSDGTLSETVRSSSGYSRDDSELGGGFNYDSTPVMSVTSTQRAYWRGETREFYTGEGWISTERSRQFNRVGEQEDLFNQGSTALPSVTITQNITMLSSRKYPVMFGAYAIKNIQITDQSAAGFVPNLLWNQKDAELKWDGYRSNARGSDKYPQSYSVTSEVPVIPVSKLEQQSYTDLFGADGPDMKAYLQLPANYPQRVTTLAEEITASGATPYAKMELLRNYLQLNYGYTNTPDESKRVSKDFVEGFLFDVKEGYCDYFSTAMVTMARSVGMPARWVKGYAPGQIADTNLMERTASQGVKPEAATYTVTNSDAHSWAEIYFGEEYGWITFEATPGFVAPVVAEEQEEEPAVEEQPEVEEEESKPAPEPQIEKETTNYTWMVWGAVGVIVVWAAYMLWKYRTALYFTVLRLRRGRELTPGEKVIAESRSWIGLMKRRGYKRLEHETLRETVVRWQQDEPEIAGQLGLLLQQFEKARYSPLEVADEEWRRTQLLTRQLRRLIKNKQVKR